MDDYAEIRSGLSELPVDDRKVAEAQRLCPILGKPLGIMGKPLKVELDSKHAIYVCCKGCIEKSKKDADGVLKKIEEFKKLPPILPEGKK